MVEQSSRIRVLVVDDHPLMREGIASVVNREADMVTVGEAANGTEGLEQFLKLRPDVTLMDLQMPGVSGLETIAQIKANVPDAAILVLTTYKGDVQAMRAIQAGATGYLLKSALRKELVDTIRSVHGGRGYIYPEVVIDMTSHLIDESLTERETAVLACVACGNSNKLVASQLNISEETVKVHMRSILGKLKARDRTHAVAIALRRGIISI